VQRWENFTGKKAERITASVTTETAPAVGTRAETDGM
jgi:hypothetical protein